jgi:hypothetical protein
MAHRDRTAGCRVTGRDRTAASGRKVSERVANPPAVNTVTAGTVRSGG